MILILTMSAIAATTTDKGDKSIPLPTPPQGYTADQIKKAIDISTKEQENQTKQIQASISGTVGIASVSQTGDAMWIIRSYIDTQYYVNKNTICNPYQCYYTYPDLNIPIKTEVWDNNLNSAPNAYVYYSLYYWNYYTNSWTNFPQGGILPNVVRYTDTSGITKQGISIPYKTYSDRYYLFGYVYYNGKWQTSMYFFNVGWY